MSILSVIISIVATSIQGVFKKQLNVKCENCEFSVSVLTTAFAFVFFLLFARNLAVPAALLIYCIAFAVCYACASVTYVLALSCGSLALTQMILSYSCVIPLAYSLLSGETLGLFQVMGVAFLLASLVVTYYQRRQPGKKQTVSAKWIIYLVLMSVTNGFCGVIMRMQQLRFAGAYDSPFMVYALFLAMLILVAAAVLREKNRIWVAFRHGTALAAACGVSNGLANYFGLICLALIPNAVYYPIKSAGELVLTSLLSIFLFKERLRKMQYIGLGLGILALIFINIS